MKRRLRWLAAGVGVALIAGCSKAKEASKAPAPSGGSPKTEVSKMAGPSLNSLPADLKNDAYSYYGLGASKPKTYDLKVTGQRPSDSSQSVTISLVSIDKDKAIFQETDSGTALGDSTQQMSLESKGLYVESVSPQILKTPHFLQLPAKLGAGTSWSSRQSVDSNGSTVDETLQFKVVGTESLTTPAGKFDALKIVGTGKGTLSHDPATLTEDSWYVKDLGMVKQVATIVSKGVTTSIVQTLRS